MTAFLLDYPNEKDFFCDNRRFCRRYPVKSRNKVVIVGQKVYNKHGTEWGRSEHGLPTRYTVPANPKEGFDVMTDKTMTFSVHEDRENEMKEILTTVYDALKQKGYNPINQLVGYILSEDPTYITTFNNARGLIRHIDRDELLQVLVKSYLSN